MLHNLSLSPYLYFEKVIVKNLLNGNIKVCIDDGKDCT